MMMRELLILEQIEEGVAVLETPAREKVRLPAKLLPKDVRPGDCLIRREDGSLEIDREETQRRRQRNTELFRKLKKKQ